MKVTPDGKVKVLDFGLAKAWGGDLGASGSSIDVSQSPTLARTGTLAGVILGTAAYTTDPTNDRDPVWSPDGKEIVYTSSVGGDENLACKRLEGSAPGEPLAGGVGRTPVDRDIAKDWVGEGNTLLYLTIGPERTLWARSLDGSGPSEPGSSIPGSTASSR